MFKRYTMEEVKRRIIDVLRSDETGMSGIELANKTGINRMTITKYLDLLNTIGIVNKKKVGSVNIWSVEQGAADFVFPMEYFEIQQRFMEAVLVGNEDSARRIMLNIINSHADRVRILLDVILPTLNTINELYDRSKLGKTEKVYLINVIMEISEFLKFGLARNSLKQDVFAICVAGSEDSTYYAKFAALTFRMLGGDSIFVGNVEDQLDPFFDIDIQRFILRTCKNKMGLVVIVVCSSKEGSLRFLTTAVVSVRARLKEKLRIATMTTPDLESLSESIGADFVTDDLQSLINWTETELGNIKSVK
jgi:predicted transcriptional regulator